jgi:hypothetical protein
MKREESPKGSKHSEVETCRAIVRERRLHFATFPVVTILAVACQGKSGDAPRRAAAPVPEDQAACVGMSPPPASVKPGQQWTEVMTFQNIGKTTWRQTDQYKLGITPPGATTWGSVYVEMAPGTIVSPGQQYTFSVDVTAPDAPGDYGFGWMMFHGESDKSYFFSQCGGQLVRVGCVPSCTSPCGGEHDGCGGTCPYLCSKPQVCFGGECCTPNCQEKSCGDSDGCGGKCVGMCPDDKPLCTYNYECRTCIASAKCVNGGNGPCNCPWDPTGCAQSATQCEHEKPRTPAH